MKRILRWFGLGLAGVAGLALIAIAVVYGTTEVMLRKHLPKSEVHIVAATDPGPAGRGARLAKLHGCSDCHGVDLKRVLFFDKLPIARIAGPNLSLEAARQTDEDLARAIRTGVPAEGAQARPDERDRARRFNVLNHEEIAALHAYLRARSAAQ